MHTKRLIGLGLLAILVAACTGGGATASPSSAASTPGSSDTPSAPPSAVPSPAASCAKEDLALVTPGTLTIGTDNPPYPPYFEFVDDAPPPWEGGDPTTGNGFESAFAYALAAELGFAKEEVVWTPVKFDQAFSPGPKPFDIDINQISYDPQRAENVDMSEGYYFVNQAVVAREGTPAAAATTIAELKPLKFGAQVGTTSLETIETVIAPATQTSIYDSNDAAITALDVGQIDAIVVDLPTAFFITAAQMEDGVIVGQLEGSQDADAEHFSVVLTKDSPLTACVDEAIVAMQSDGRLEAITQEWLSDKANAPVIRP